MMIYFTFIFTLFKSHTDFQLKNKVSILWKSGGDSSEQLDSKINVRII